jgi:hypothetical protein
MIISASVDDKGRRSHPSPVVVTTNAGGVFRFSCHSVSHWLWQSDRLTELSTAFLSGQAST